MLAAIFCFLIIVLQPIKKNDTIITEGLEKGWKNFRVINREKDLVLEEGRLFMNKKEGVWRTYFENRFLSTVIEYHNGLRQGFSLYCAGDGTLLREENYFNDSLNGLVRVYGRNRRIREESNYKSGLLHGNSYIYNVDGRLQEHAFYKSGMRDSVNLWYYPGGQLKVTYEYANNNLNGSSVSYYESGAIKNKAWYLDGQPHGSWVEYFENGKINIEGAYHKGVKKGVWKVYDEKGNLTGQEPFDSKKQIRTKP